MGIRGPSFQGWERSRRANVFQSVSWRKELETDQQRVSGWNHILISFAGSKRRKKVTPRMRISANAVCINLRVRDRDEFHREDRSEEIFMLFLKLLDKHQSFILGLKKFEHSLQKEHWIISPAAHCYPGDWSVTDWTIYFYRHVCPPFCSFV